VLGGNTSTLIRDSLHSIDSGKHTCLVTDALGNSGSATVQIVVKGKLLYGHFCKTKPDNI